MKQNSVLLVLLIMLSNNVLSKTFVIDNKNINASDKNIGSLESPLKTVQTGANRAYAGDTILVKAGIYRENVIPPRGGTSIDSPITYLAAPGEHVSIRASNQITEWEQQDSYVWSVTVDNALFGDFNPFKKNVSGSWLKFGHEHHLGEVYLDGKSFIERQTLEEVTTESHSWFAQVDETNTRIWANFKGINPNTSLAEINVRECIIFPDLQGLKHIVIDGFDIRHAASNWAPPDAFQKGAIGTRFGYGWIIQNCNIVDVKNVGICIGAVEDYHWDNRNLPDINTFGHHIIRNNTIKRCGQAGIVGAYGCVKSIIEGNFIEDIAYKKQYGGAEIGGIKLHFPIDVIIRNNHIRGVRTKDGGPAGIWLDWGSQNVRVTGNIIYDCDSNPLKFEVNHGPILVDNNVIMGSETLCWGSGAIFVHNLFYNTSVRFNKDTRVVPWYKPHSTIEAGRDVIHFCDDQWINNLFIDGTGLGSVPVDKPGYFFNHNVYLDGALKHKKQDTESIVETTPSNILFEVDSSFAAMQITLGDPIFNASYSQITSKLIGQLQTTKMTIETPDGKPIVISADYYGNPIKKTHVIPGPFQDLKSGANSLKLWPKGD